LLQINDLQKQVQIKQTAINDLLNKEIELQDKFQMATSDSRFADFLRKIYMKKYKPPGVRNVDDGKSLKQAVTENILYTSTHGCCQGFFLTGEVKYLFANVHFSFYECFLWVPLELCHKECLRSFGINMWDVNIRRQPL
jgi:hypothetical protein